MTEESPPVLPDRRRDDVLIKAIEALVAVGGKQILAAESLHEDVKTLVAATDRRDKTVQAALAEEQQRQRARRKRDWIRYGISMVFITGVLLVCVISLRTVRTINSCINKSTDPKSCYVKTHAEQGKVVLSITDANHNGQIDVDEVLAAVNAKS